MKIRILNVSWCNKIWYSNSSDGRIDLIETQSCTVFYDNQYSVNVNRLDNTNRKFSSTVDSTLHSCIVHLDAVMVRCIITTKKMQLGLGLGVLLLRRMDVFHVLIIINLSYIWRKWTVGAHIIILKRNACFWCSNIA